MPKKITRLSPDSQGVRIWWRLRVTLDGVRSCKIIALPAEIARIRQAADLNERLLGGGADPIGCMSGEFVRLIREEAGKWAKAVRDTTPATRERDAS